MLSLAWSFLGISCVHSALLLQQRCVLARLGDLHVTGSALKLEQRL